MALRENREKTTGRERDTDDGRGPETDYGVS